MEETPPVSLISHPSTCGPGPQMASTPTPPSRPQRLSQPQPMSRRVSAKAQGRCSCPPFGIGAGHSQQHGGHSCLSTRAEPAGCRPVHTHTAIQRRARALERGWGAESPGLQLSVFTSAFPRPSLHQQNKDVSVPGAQRRTAHTRSMCCLQWRTPAQEGSLLASSQPSPSPSSPRQLRCSRWVL